MAVKNGGSKAHIFMRGVFVAEADPQKAKALLRLLIEELPVNGRKEILPTYRLVTPVVCAMSEKVEAAGIEPEGFQNSVPAGKTVIPGHESEF